MVIITMLGIAITWFTLGHEFAFAGGTTTASTGWSIVICLWAFVAAIVGGYVAAWGGGADNHRSVRILVGLVLVLGIVSFVYQLARTPPQLPDGKTMADLSFTEAGRYAVSPTWYNAVVIAVGVAGVLLGARGRR
jgi:hypothetical protein